MAKVTSFESPTPPSSTHIGSSKPCRYGDHCSRPGCRFRHSFDSTPAPAPVNNPYCSNNWLPHSISIALKNNELIIEKIDEKNNQTTNRNGEDDESNSFKKRYDLSAVVCYINDQTSTEKRNIVALINVPVSYVTDGNVENRWFLFNDFSIAPVSAQEAVWFSLDWKVPCVLYYSTREVIAGESNIVPPISKVRFWDNV